MVSLVVIVELDLPHCLEGPNVCERHGDLDWLSLSTFGRSYAFCIIYACVDNSVPIRLFALQLQWDKHATNGNVLDLQCCGLNLHLHLVGGAGEQLDCAVLTEALAVYLGRGDGQCGLEGAVAARWAEGTRREEEGADGCRATASSGCLRPPQILSSSW